MSDSPTSWPATCSIIGESKRTGYPGKDVTACKTSNYNCFLLVKTKNIPIHDVKLVATFMHRDS